MNLRRLDVRMALPQPPRTAAVLGNLPRWSEGLPTVGVELPRPRRHRPRRSSRRAGGNGR